MILCLKQANLSIVFLFAASFKHKGLTADGHISDIQSF